MAAGDIKWFAQALHDLGKKIHDLGVDDIRGGIVTSATVPTVDTPAPHWGGTGTTNFAANQVALGAAYTGPIALGVEQWVLVAGGARFRLTNDVTVAQDAGTGFANGAFMIFYNHTDTNKRALGFMDLGGPAGNVAGPIDNLWNGASNDVLSLSQA